jgi:hypothetical protein
MDRQLSTPCSHLAEDARFDPIIQPAFREPPSATVQLHSHIAIGIPDRAALPRELVFSTKLSFPVCRSDFRPFRGYCCRFRSMAEAIRLGPPDPNLGFRLLFVWTDFHPSISLWSR